MDRIARVVGVVMLIVAGVVLARHRLQSDLPQPQQDQLARFEASLRKFQEAGRAAAAVTLDESHRAASQRLVGVVDRYLAESGLAGPTDAISAMASVVGDLAILAARELRPEDHDLVVGQRIFSDRINMLFFDDRSGLELHQYSSASVVGGLRDALVDDHVRAEDFAVPGEIVVNLAASTGDPRMWGGVAPSVPDTLRPGRLPLRFALDTRQDAVSALEAVGDNPVLRLRVATLALSAVVIRAIEGTGGMDGSQATTLALETAHAVAKTAPMLEPLDAPTPAMLEDIQVARIPGSMEEYRAALKGRPAR